MGKGALAPPRKCCKVFCVELDQLFMHYFHNFLEVRVVHLVVLACVLRATTKKMSSTFFEEKVHPREKILATPMNLPTPEKILRAPMK